MKVHQESREIIEQVAALLAGYGLLVEGIESTSAGVRMTVMIPSPENVRR